MIAIVPENDTQTVEVQEYQTVTVKCAPDIAADMHADGHVVVSPSITHGLYEVKAKHKVGVLRYGKLELRIIPKVPVARLLYLASFHVDEKAWRQVETLLGDVDDPLSAIAHALVFHSRGALKPTPLQGYVTHEESSRRIRGRIMFESQLSKRAGVQLPVDLRFDEYELGIIENRVIVAALQTVAHFVVDRSIQRQLRRLYLQLADVEPWSAGQRIPQIVIGRMNARYAPALALARLVLDRRSLEYSAQRSTGTAFLLNMNVVFESYLEAALRNALERIGGRVKGQYRLSLDYDNNISIRPDITWWREGKCVAVIDAKYKRTTNNEFPNADTYQMLAYCTRLSLKRGILVYADLDGTETGGTVLRNADIEILVTSIDISGSIERLDASVQRLVDMVGGADSDIPLCDASR